MSLVVLQLTAIGSLLGFLIWETVISIGSRRKEDSGESLWWIRAKRIGPAKNNFRNKLVEICSLNGDGGLAEERYWMGNRMTDDIYVDSSGERVRLFLNVQRERIYVSVLRGRVTIQNHIYLPDRTKRIELGDRAKVQIDDMEVSFYCKSSALQH